MARLYELNSNNFLFVIGEQHKLTVKKIFSTIESRTFHSNLIALWPATCSQQRRQTRPTFMSTTVARRPHWKPCRKYSIDCQSLLTTVMTMPAIPSLSRKRMKKFFAKWTDDTIDFTFEEALYQWLDELFIASLFFTVFRLPSIRLRVKKQTLLMLDNSVRRNEGAQVWNSRKIVLTLAITFRSHRSDEIEATCRGRGKLTFRCWHTHKSRGILKVELYQWWPEAVSCRNLEFHGP